jgi:hypothetical protein
MTMKSLGPGARKIYYHRLGPYALLFSKLKTILHTDFSLGHSVLTRPRQNANHVEINVLLSACKPAKTTNYKRGLSNADSGTLHIQGFL